ncbi:SurA N-terminal domain-containing protein [Psychrobium sp. MM17-31]|uniref:SurA N-terminal domain-containing protein n=1 Tax=Psychrobium sp. MM17-31 TaxID=2917758 RepID=UPI001EF62177|nr:SurA N-terminal domain-containing protein [Psychrobium sp. MM17-31]MCG7529878.1 SurA N-terminal domain-containing protein [Psychrobium sp. MM17-31]
MLERIREGSQGVVAKAILGLVILTFALAGIGSYLGGSSEVASVIVNGETISQAQVDNEFAKERSNLERQYGEMFKMIANNPTYMESVRKGVQERLIAQALISQTAAAMDLRVGDEQIKKTIRDMQEFHVDGQFNNDRYLSLVRSSGYRVEQFRELLRVDLTRQQLMGAVIGSDFVLKNEAEQIAKLEKQLRDIRYISVSANDFLNDVEISDDEVAEYYDVNSGQFTTPEQLSVEFVELKVADLLPRVSVEDSKVREQYESNLAQYQSPERRRVSHILFEFGDDEAATRAKAEAALARVKAGEDFAALAKELSDDTFSGEEGGDLDWMTKDGDEDAFTNAAFAVENGATSDIVETESGLHIIKVTDLDAAATKAFDEVASEIEEELLAQQAKELFYELQQQLTDTAFSVSENLTEAAAEIESQVKSTALFTRANVPAAVNFPEVIDAAFSEDVLGENLNSEVINVSPDHLMVVRKKEHIPSEVKPMSDVKVQIVDILKQQKAGDLAKEKAEQYLASWQAGETIDGVTVVEKADVARTTRDIDNAIVAAAFKMAKTGENNAELVSTVDGQAVVDLVAVKEANDVTSDIDSVLQRLNATQSGAAYKAFIDSLKEKSDIQYPAS